MKKIETMKIVVPSVRKSNGGSVNNIIQEQEQICLATTAAIEKTAIYRKEREIREEFGRRLRICNDFLGMRGFRKLGCIYREGYINEGKGHVCEHVIPMTQIVSMLMNGEISFHQAIFFPIALVKKQSDEKIRASGRAKAHFDITFPFNRYRDLDINIYTWQGDLIDPSKWSMDDHWELVKRTPEIAAIFTNYK